MTLSRRDEEILDEIAGRLAEQDPTLIAEFARPWAARGARRASGQNAAPEPRSR